MWNTNVKRDMNTQGVKIQYISYQSGEGAGGGGGETKVRNKLFNMIEVVLDRVSSNEK